MSQKFKKKDEDFACAQCGALVRGNGYTNHCPECLWSLHVDIYPGDRAASCGALMEPAGFVAVAGGYVLIHRCAGCGVEKKNKLAPNDNLALLSKLS